MKQNQNNSWKFFFIASFAFAIVGVVGFFSKDESDKLAYLISALLVAIGNIIIAYKVAGNKDIKDNDQIKHKKKKFYEKSKSDWANLIFLEGYALFCVGIMYAIYYSVLLVKNGFQKETLITLVVILLITSIMSLILYIAGSIRANKASREFEEEFKEYKEKRESSTNKEEE